MNFKESIKSIATFLITLGLIFSVVIQYTHYCAGQQKAFVSIQQDSQCSMHAAQEVQKPSCHQVSTNQNSCCDDEVRILEQDKVSSALVAYQFVPTIIIHNRITELSSPLHIGLDMPLQTQPPPKQWLSLSILHQQFRC